VNDPDADAAVDGAGSARQRQEEARMTKAAKVLAIVLLAVGALSASARAQQTVGLPPPDSTVADAFKAQKHFSPYAGRNFPTQVYWGDTHLHTGMSMDAGAFGARLSPQDAYRFALGEELTSSTGLQVKLSRPLDFLVVADHSDNMGFFPRLFAGDPDMLADSTGKRARSPRHWPLSPAAPPIAPPGRKRSRRRRCTTIPAASPPSSATSGRPIRAATTCIAL
jgi:hypothetical protein